MRIFSPDMFKSLEHCLLRLCSQHEWTCVLVLFVLTSMTATLTLYSVSCVSCFMCVLLSVLISNIGSIANRTVKVQVQTFQTCSDNLSTIIIIIITHTDPWVVHKLSNGHPLVGLCFQQLNDELFGYRRSEKTQNQTMCICSYILI